VSKFLKSLLKRDKNKRKRRQGLSGLPDFPTPPPPPPMPIIAQIEEPVFIDPMNNIREMATFNAAVQVDNVQRQMDVMVRNMERQTLQQQMTNMLADTQRLFRGAGFGAEYLANAFNLMNPEPAGPQPPKKGDTVIADTSMGKLRGYVFNYSNENLDISPNPRSKKSDITIKISYKKFSNCRLILTERITAGA